MAYQYTAWGSHAMKLLQFEQRLKVLTHSIKENEYYSLKKADMSDGEMQPIK